MGIFKIVCYCTICGKLIGSYFPSLVRKTCSKECYKKQVSKNTVGKNNPNYRHGKNIENKCIDCGKLIDARSLRCYSCKGKNTIPNFKGCYHTDESKRIIGDKSSKKFTNEYMKKVRKVYEENGLWLRIGEKKRTLNGYVLVKNHDHPNRNCQDDILEHILVMSQYLSRPLTDEEIIHHIDGSRDNNSIDNLFLCNLHSHRKTHTSFGRLLRDLLRLNIVMFDRDEGVYKLVEGVDN